MGIWLCAATKYEDEKTGVAIFGGHRTPFRPDVCYMVSAAHWPLIAQIISESDIIHPTDAKSGLWSNDGRHIGPGQCQLIGTYLGMRAPDALIRMGLFLVYDGPLYPGSRCKVSTRVDGRMLRMIARHFMRCGMEWDGIVIV